MRDTLDGIRAWGHSKGIAFDGNQPRQFEKLVEEVLTAYENPTKSKEIG